MAHKLQRTLLMSFMLCLASVSFAQETDRDVGMKAYHAGDYSRAADFLKRATKRNGSDAPTWAMLGSSYLGIGWTKDAIKAFNKAVKLEPQNDVYVAGLAVAYLAASDDKAAETANAALKINPKNIDAHYVLGAVALDNHSYISAYQRAQRIIELDPVFARAYRLKSLALVASFAIQAGTIVRPAAMRYELLTEAAAALEQFQNLSTDPKIKKDYEGQVQALKFFAEYYSHPENQPPPTLDNAAPSEPSRTDVKITSKPFARFTEESRQRGVQGSVILLVPFQADGKIGPIMIVKSLPAGLDAEAVRAAQGIKFTPATAAGQPVTVVKSIEYSFSIF